MPQRAKVIVCVSSLSWLTPTQGSSLLGKLYQVSIPVKCKSWTAMMEMGRDPREGIFLFLGLTVSWFLSVAYRIVFGYPQILSCLLENSFFIFKNCFFYTTNHMTCEHTPKNCLPSFVRKETIPSILFAHGLHHDRPDFSNKQRKLST